MNNSSRIMGVLDHTGYGDSNTKRSVNNTESYLPSNNNHRNNCNISGILMVQNNIGCGCTTENCDVMVVMLMRIVID